MFKAIKKLKTFNKLPQEQRRFVFFSESSNYYPTFSPIIREFRKRAIPFTYLSMDAADPGLELAAEAGISTFCLGSGVGFLYFMGMIKADVVVMTTPGLQSLSLKRSPGAAHYVHIVHAPAGNFFVSKIFLRSFRYRHVLRAPSNRRDSAAGAAAGNPGKEASQDGLCLHGCVEGKAGEGRRIEAGVFREDYSTGGPYLGA